MSQCGRIVLGRLAFSFDRQEAEIARRPFRPARRFIYRTQVFWLRTGNSQTSDLTSAGLVLAYLGENCLGGNGAGAVGIRYQAAGVRGAGHGIWDTVRRIAGAMTRGFTTKVPLYLRAQNACTQIAFSVRHFVSCLLSPVFQKCRCIRRC